MDLRTMKAIRPEEPFAIDDVARIILASLLDRLDSALPPHTPIGEVDKELLVTPPRPYKVSYVWGLVEATLQTLSTLTGLCMADVEKVISLESALREYASWCIAGESGKDRQKRAKRVVDALLDDFLTIC